MAKEASPVLQVYKLEAELERAVAWRHVLVKRGREALTPLAWIVAGKLKRPKKIAFAFWALSVAISGTVMFLTTLGILDPLIPQKIQRDALLEIDNQILNALFTMLCLYVHPERILHLYRLYKWRPQDIKLLREVFCKNGTYKPQEWGHLLVVVLLLHLNCLAQYVLCGLNWGFPKAERPEIGVAICLALAIAAPASAGLYTILSPLGKDYAQAAAEYMEIVVEETITSPPLLLRNEQSTPMV